MTSKAQMALDQAINEIENEWGYEGIKEEMHEIMKPILKDLEDLQTLKSFINNYLQFQLVYDDIDHYEIIPVKQYIGNSGCLLLTEDKMKKILDICND